MSRLLAAKTGQAWDALAEPLVTDLTKEGMAEAEANWAVEVLGPGTGQASGRIAASRGANDHGHERTRGTAG